MDDATVPFLRNGGETMKKWFLVAAVILAVVLSACGGGTTQTGNAKSVFDAWLDAAKAIESMRADYNAVIESCSKDSTQCTKVNIAGRLYTTGNKRLDESELTIGAYRQQIKQYSFEDEVYVATLIEGVWVAKKVELSIYFNSDESQAEMESMYERGGLIVGNTIETRSISGEECDCITLSAQLSKLSTVDKKYLLFSGGFSGTPNVGPYVDALKSYSAKLCLLPNGMVLESETNLEFNADALPPDGAVSSHVITTITYYELNPVVPDSLFDLP